MDVDEMMHRFLNSCSSNCNSRGNSWCKHKASQGFFVLATAIPDFYMHRGSQPLKSSAVATFCDSTDDAAAIVARIR